MGGTTSRTRGGGTSTFARRVAAVIFLGTLARVALALLTHGHAFDMQSLRILRHDLAAHGIDVYGFVNVGNYRWPYPPAFFPWVALSGEVAGGHGHVFEVVVRLPQIAGDALLAWLAQEYLRLRGASERTRLAATALIALSPVAVVASGYVGQIDQLAILPAVLALFAWERLAGGRRAVVAGLLIGLGAALKTVPVLMLIPLLPTARSWREAGALVAGAAAVPLALLAPFLIAQPHPTIDALRSYHGYPGQGGLTLALQPGLADRWLTGSVRHGLQLNWANRAINDHAFVVSGAIYAAVAVGALRVRARPLLAACLLWAATFAFGPAFFFQYLMWGLPFFVMAGYLRATALLQALVAVPLLVAVTDLRTASGAVYIYVPLMLAAWILLVWAVVALARGLARDQPPPDLALPRGAATRLRSA